MRRALLLVIALFGLWAGVAIAQTTTETPDFIFLRQIGEPRPQGIQYEPQFDRFAWVDVQGRLLLVDAATYTPQHTLYESGAYNAYRFSHDGRWLALAIDRRIELWSTESGERAAVFEPAGANLVQGPLHFTPDDRFLLLDAVVPAPQELRRSENDTSMIPWLWDLEAGRGERASRYPSLEDGYAFFEYRNGLVIGANNVLIGGIPNRLMLIDGSETSFPVVGEIQANRFERDPITVWRSATDTMLYTDPGTGQIIQIDTSGGAQFNLALGSDLNYRSLPSMDNLRLANSARVLCRDAGGVETSLLRLIYGEGYLGYQNYDPLTFMLIDVLQPLTMGQERGALLLYAFNERRGRGSLELIRPQDVQQMLLSPDATRLMVRRASGSQDIEVYDLRTCTRDLTITPAEADGSGLNALAFNGDGSVIISDFQRFDAWSGEMLAHEVQYTRPFERVTFSEDNRMLVTTRGNERVWWDVETGQPIQRALAPALDDPTTQLLQVSEDDARYLLRTSQSDGTQVVELRDVRQGTVRTLEIPPFAGALAEVASVSRSWESILVRYPTADGFGANAISVYTFGRGQVLVASGFDLPPNSQQMGWLDERTIYVAGDRFGIVPQPVYGVEYASSGIPACFADAFPSQGDTFGLIWEGIRLRSNAESLDRLALRLCAALPDTPEAAIAALTPTPSFFYNSDPTPLPYAIPGVPICITQRFPFEAVRYAELWREISAGASPEQLTELETMICEGLVGSVGGIAATPTIDPNLNVPPTPTPIDAAPVTTGGGAEFRPLVIAIDIETGARSQGDYLPATSEARNLSLIEALFTRQFNRAPSSLRLSPDGRLAAEIDPNGFVRIYRMSRSYDELVADQQLSVATLQAGVRSIGLVPTATMGFEAVAEKRPTMTPTVIPPTPALSQSPLPGWNPTVTEVCPARQLYTLADLPPGYAAGGRLLTTSPRGEGALWVIEPSGGRSYSDAAIPLCSSGVCAPSLDGVWIARQNDGIFVSRRDGSSAMTVIPPEDMGISPSMQWQPDGTLLISYNGYLPTAFPGQGIVQRVFDPATGHLSEPSAPLDVMHPVRIGELPIQNVDSQPGGMLALVTTPNDVGGSKYWIYDRELGTSEYFASGFIIPSWDALGRYLAYQMGDHVYRFDVVTLAHYRLDEYLPGTWSPDYTRQVSFSFDEDDASARISAGELPLKLQVQDQLTGAITRYCVPETGFDRLGGALVWSPDGRYLAFVMPLPIDGDFFPTPGPTLAPYTIAPTATPIPLDVQYDAQFSRTLILDTQTGYVTIVGQDANSVVGWIEGGAG